MNSDDYDRGYGDGYQAGVRDAQIELIKALGGLDGARAVTVHRDSGDELITI